MSLLSLIDGLNLPGEEYYLQTRAAGDEEDDAGNLTLEWTNVQQIYGIIQKSENIPANELGDNEEALYLGFFEPDFEIPYEQTGEYRIKHDFPSDPEFIRYFKIRAIDRNLKMNSEYHHYEIELELERKWKNDGI